MNSLKLLPQLLPPPKFPVPETSRLADKLAYALEGTYRIKDGVNRTTKIWKNDYYGGVLFYREQKIAIYLYQVLQDSRSRVRYLFLNQPEEIEIPKAILFDRLNAILKRLSLPTLHEIVKGYWIFTDGVPWNGKRMLRFEDYDQVFSEKEILVNRVFSRP